MIEYVDKEESKDDADDKLLKEDVPPSPRWRTLHSSNITDYQE